MKLTSLILSLLMTSSFAHAQKTLNTAVVQKMINISGTIKELGPYIASENEFVKEKNKKKIEKKLLELTDLFKKLAAHPVIPTEGLAINQTLMTEQLKQTVNLFKTNRRSQARAKFTAALNLCVNCHTQSPGQTSPKLFQDIDIQKMKLTNFEKAEIYFIGREYDKALPLYNSFLLKSKKNDDDEFILKALQRELIYFVKVKKSFSEGKVHFDKYLNVKLFNSKISKEVSEWSRTLGDKSLWENYNPVSTKEEEMEKFMKGFIADDEEGPIFTVENSSEVYDLNLSTILLDYYNAHPQTKLGGKILYWLAILDKRINDDLFFSVGDYYLMSCMEKYSKDPVARDCFDAYQEDLVANYISKDKKNFSLEIIERLNSLKKRINYVDEE